MFAEHLGTLKNIMMKKLILFAVLGGLFFGSCAQKEEQREEYKEEHSVEEKRNAGVDSAAFNDKEQVQDSMEVK